MDLKELKEALATDEGKALLKELTEASTTGLSSKNEELLYKLNKSKEVNAEMTDRLNAFDKLKDEADDAKILKDNDLDAMRTKLDERHQRAMDAETSKSDKLQKQLNTHVVDKGLMNALVDANVSKNHIKGAIALIKSEYEGEVGDNDGSPFAKFDGQAVDKFVTNWAQSDEGKAYVSADNNSGGGSNGSNGAGQANTGKKVMSRSAFDNMSPHEKMETSKQGVQLTED